MPGHTPPSPLAVPHTTDNGGAGNDSDTAPAAASPHANFLPSSPMSQNPQLPTTASALTAKVVNTDTVQTTSNKAHPMASQPSINLKATESTATASESSVDGQRPHQHGPIIEERDSLDYFFENADSDTSREVSVSTTQPLHAKDAEDERASPIRQLIKISANTSSDEPSHEFQDATTMRTMKNLLDDNSATDDSDAGAEGDEGGKDENNEEKQQGSMAPTPVNAMPARQMSRTPPQQQQHNTSSERVIDDGVDTGALTPQDPRARVAPMRRSGSMSHGLSVATANDEGRDVLSYIVDRVMKMGETTDLEQEALDQALRTAESLPHDGSDTSSPLKLQNEIIMPVSGSYDEGFEAVGRGTYLNTSTLVNPAYANEEKRDEDADDSSVNRPAFFIHNRLPDVSPLPSPVVSMSYPPQSDIEAQLTSPQKRLKRARDKMREIERYVFDKVSHSPTASVADRSQRSFSVASTQTGMSLANGNTQPGSIKIVSTSPGSMPQVMTAEEFMKRQRQSRRRDLAHNVGIGLLVVAGVSFVGVIIFMCFYVWA